MFCSVIYDGVRGSLVLTSSSSFSAMAVQTPPIQWAQRKDSIYVTIALPDVDKSSAVIDLTAPRLVFKYVHTLLPALGPVEGAIGMKSDIRHM